ncbi:conserved rodent malaria protein, unknown function [Plasmodium yoelii]|uniref:Tryptophan/threonine-rich plasmodium antigen C-terminal domain-containing protein n=1 Tax=Plasmodium yoelii TaxID=5861 RepID=A0A077Y7T4_PLAYE|nr:conserved rodent malaria protein, unknown function [Plasmodium yoelii]
METINTDEDINTLSVDTIDDEHDDSQILFSDEDKTSDLDIQNVPNVANSTNELLDSETVDETLSEALDEPLINSDGVITNEIPVGNAEILRQIIILYSKINMIRFNSMISKFSDSIKPIIHYPLAHNAITYSKVITDKLENSRIFLLKYKEELENLQVVQRLREYTMNMHIGDNPLQLLMITFAALIISFLLPRIFKRINNNIKLPIPCTNEEHKNKSEKDVDNIEESEECKEELWESWKSDLDYNFEEFNSKLEDDAKKMIEVKGKEWNQWKENYENKWMHYNENLERAYKKNILTESSDFDDEQWAEWVKNEVEKSMDLEFKNWLLKNKYNMDKWARREWDNWKKNIFDEWLSSDWKVREDKYWKKWKYINKRLIKLYKSKFKNMKKWENRLNKESLEWKEWVEVKNYFFTNKKSNEWEKFENDTIQNYEEWRNEFIDKLIKEKKWNLWKDEKENYKPPKRKLKEKEKTEKEKTEKEQKSDLNNSSSKNPNSPNTENNAFNFVYKFFKQWNTPFSNFKPEYGSRNNLNTANRYYMESNRNDNNLNTANRYYMESNRNDNNLNTANRYYMESNRNDDNLNTANRYYMESNRNDDNLNTANRYYMEFNRNDNNLNTANRYYMESNINENNLNTTNRYSMEPNRNENNLNTHNNDYNLLNKACNFWKSINGSTASLNDNCNHRDFRNTNLNTSNRRNWKWNNRNGPPKSTYEFRKRPNTQNSDYNPMVGILKYMDTQNNHYNLSNVNWNH